MNRKESLVYRMFGKPFKQLTKEEQKQYHNALYLQSHPNAKNFTATKAYKVMGKRSKDFTNEDKRIYMQKTTNPKGYKHTKSYQMFGKRYKDLTKEEAILYRESFRSYTPPVKYKESRAYKLFGKRRKDLTEEEIRLYNKILKQESREKNKK